MREAALLLTSLSWSAKQSSLAPTSTCLPQENIFKKKKIKYTYTYISTAYVYKHMYAVFGNWSIKAAQKNSQLWDTKILYHEAVVKGTESGSLGSDCLHLNASSPSKYPCNLFVP